MTQRACARRKGCSVTKEICNARNFFEKGMRFSVFIRCFMRRNSMCHWCYSTKCWTMFYELTGSLDNHRCAPTSLLNRPFHRSGGHLEVYCSEKDIMECPVDKRIHLMGGNSILVKKNFKPCYSFSISFVSG